jgi:hypothetical protein
VQRSKLTSPSCVYVYGITVCQQTVHQAEEEGYRLVKGEGRANQRDRVLELIRELGGSDASGSESESDDDEDTTGD